MLCCHRNYLPKSRAGFTVKPRRCCSQHRCNFRAQLLPASSSASCVVAVPISRSTQTRLLIQPAARTTNPCSLSNHRCSSDAAAPSSIDQPRRNAVPARIPISIAQTHPCIAALSSIPIRALNFIFTVGLFCRHHPGPCPSISLSGAAALSLLSA